MRFFRHAGCRDDARAGARRVVILFVGATSKVGRFAIPLLRKRDLAVRAFTRQPAASDWPGMAGAHVIQGDLRDYAAVRRACDGVTQVVSCAHGFLAKGRDGSRKVDFEANNHLVAAARDAGVKRFVYVSARPARRNHPVDLFRHKAAAEERVRTSGLDYTILRPSIFMETWVEILGASIQRKGRVIVFGRGDNPINFISARDVARYVVAVLENGSFENSRVELGGPENLSLNEVVWIIEQACGRTAKKIHLSVPLLRSLAFLLTPFSPIGRRMMLAGADMATGETPFDLKTMPSIEAIVPTRLEEVARGYFPASTA